MKRLLGLDRAAMPLGECSIWRSFIPFSSYQVFQRGGYFTVEVISDEVAVISLNTMYFYDSNKGGCCDTALDWTS